LIYRLAQSTRGRARVVVLTDGFGRQYLERMPALENLLVLGFQPYERLPEVLAGADVLVATLSADAGQFAVPSKVLTYLAAARPVLLASPADNAAARAVRRSGGGIVVDPDDPARWIAAAARELAGSEEMRQQLGRRGRLYAENAFRIDAIADRFEQVLLRACTGHDTVESPERARYAAAR
jgi:glycosyltransferase involved in cell wall biosynthesis